MQTNTVQLHDMTFNSQCSIYNSIWKSSSIAGDAYNWKSFYRKTMTMRQIKNGKIKTAWWYKKSRHSSADVGVVFLSLEY